jgi:hypothetical protein
VRKKDFNLTPAPLGAKAVQEYSSRVTQATRELETWTSATNSIN